MASRLVALEVDAVDPGALAQFWARLLGRTVDASGTTLPGLTNIDFTVRFVAASTLPSQLHWMHFDLTSRSDADQRRSVEMALSLGGRHLDVGQRGDEGHVVLADPEGNEFCVIEPANGFLADTARIGALAGDGMPAVGYFWSDVLGWPLVWDQDEETAIQSPAGGTKLTWGGPPVRVKTQRNRLRWVLESSGPVDHERARLCGLGARVTAFGPLGYELLDPGGNELTLTMPATA